MKFELEIVNKHATCPSSAHLHDSPDNQVAWDNPHDMSGGVSNSHYQPKVCTYTKGVSTSLSMITHLLK